MFSIRGVFQQVGSQKANWSQVSYLFEDPYESAKMGKSNVALLRETPHLEPGLEEELPT